ERGDLGALYAIRGAGVTNDEQASLPIQSVAGVIDFVPTVFKYMRQRPESVIGSVGTAPTQPQNVAATQGGSATGSGFKTGEAYRWVVQAVNISGISIASQAATLTFSADNRPADLTWTRVAG